MNKNQNGKADSVGKSTAFPSISSLIGLVHSIFWQEKDVPSPLEKDIKALYAASTFYSQAKHCIFHCRKIIIISLIGKKVNNKNKKLLGFIMEKNKSNVETEK